MKEVVIQGPDGEYVTTVELSEEDVNILIEYAIKKILEEELKKSKE